MVTLLVAIAALWIGYLCELCYAAAGGGGDESENWMERKTISDLLRAKKKDERAPERWQIGLALGSIVVTVAVLKYL